ncbi:MAG: tRNA lysidine(34) synthetase TilS [Armatimonadota bacterium]
MSEARRDPLHGRILQAEERYSLLAGARRVLVGVSGGQDSVALLHALVTLDGLEAQVGAIHVHHGLRGAEADADEACVRGLCEGLGVACFVVHRRVAEEAEQSGLNIELAGRRARYQEYERIAREQGFDRIATGHTGSDRAETLLLNLLRGAGLRGMASIPPRRGSIIRPLICATRADTGEYCRRHALPVCIDRSNLDLAHARRNQVRLKVMPALQELFPGAEQALMRACQAVEEELAWTEPLIDAWVEHTTIEDEPQRTALSIRRLAELHPGAMHRVLLEALERLGRGREDLAREHVERIAHLVVAQRTGRAVELPGGLRARREYERLVLEAQEPEEELPDECVELVVPGEATLAARGVTVRAELATAPQRLNSADRLSAWLDARAVGGRLILRSARPGDRLVPLGMSGSKKLYDLFVDDKVPQRLRRRTPVVTDAEGRILWVVGQRLAEAARAASGRPAVRLTATFD